MVKKTKILATIGPSSETVETMEKLVQAGVNAFRLNFSHGTHEYHKANIDKIRQVEAKLGQKIGIFQDICGPKIRVGKLSKPEFKLKNGDKLFFHKEEILGEQIDENSYKICINQPQILAMLKVGEHIYLCDGQIRTKVVKANDDLVETVVENDGILRSNKGVNFPNTKINIEVITQKDIKDLEFGAKNGVHFVAISFVQTADDIKKARQILNSFGSNAQIYAKIEKFDAVEHIDEIIAVSDGIMVARGDLGIEVPYYSVPTIQKQIIKKANEAAKPVITATQMMLSMAEHETATRAEISDVANAVLDGTDVVMLSEESAVGINPVAVVKAMSNTIIKTQEIYPFNKFDFENYDETDMIASSTTRLAVNLGVDGILALTSSGQSAIKMSRYRPNIDIIAITHNEQTAYWLTLCWGISNSFVIAKEERLHTLMAKSIKIAVNNGCMSDTKTYIMTAGYPTGVAGSSDLIRILRKPQIDYYLNEADK
ncbi:MAG: pyruvate kinase [Campylobacter sp.]